MLEANFSLQHNYATRAQADTEHNQVKVNQPDHPSTSDSAHHVTSALVSDSQSQQYLPQAILEGTGSQLQQVSDTMVIGKIMC